MGQDTNRLRFPYVFVVLRSHLLHPQRHHQGRHAQHTDWQADTNRGCVGGAAAGVATDIRTALPVCEGGELAGGQADGGAAGVAALHGGPARGADIEIY
jgi:hypothetical protein